MHNRNAMVTGASSTGVAMTTSFARNGPTSSSHDFTNDFEPITSQVSSSSLNSNYTPNKPMLIRSTHHQKSPLITLIRRLCCCCMSSSKTSRAAGNIRGGMNKSRVTVSVAILFSLFIFLFLVLQSKFNIMSHSSNSENKLAKNSLHTKESKSHQQQALKLRASSDQRFSCEDGGGYEVTDSKLTILVTPSLRESDFKFITSQNIGENVILEWLLFKEKDQTTPKFLKKLQKKVILVDEIKNEMELLKIGLEHSTGEYLFLLPYEVHLFGTSSQEIFKLKLSQLKCNTQSAILGSMLIYPINVISQKPSYNYTSANDLDSSFNIYSMTYRLSKRDKNIPVPYHYRRGRNYFSLPSSSKIHLDNNICVAFAGAFFKTSKFKNVKFDIDYMSRELNEIQLCLQLYNQKKNIVFDHQPQVDDFSVVVPYVLPNVESVSEEDNSNPWSFVLSRASSRNEEEHSKSINAYEQAPPTTNRFIPFNTYSIGNVKKFLKKHTQTLNEILDTEYKKHMNNMTSMSLVWDFGAGSCSGWFMETEEFVTNLDMEYRAPNLRIITGREDMCLGLESYKFESLDRLISRDDISSDIDIFISHKPPTRYPKSFPYKGLVQLSGIPKYVIGRSMHESEKLPQEWISNLKLVNEVWLPSSFLVDILVKKYHVSPEKLQVVPEPIDTDFYSPYYSKYLRIDQLKKIVKQLDYEPNHYHFYSVFKYEERKGPEYLLMAYFDEFANVKDVTLHLQTYMFMHPNGRDQKVVEQAIDEIRHEFLKTRKDLKRENLPRINIISQVVPTTVMPHMYHHMDCFVLPSRGEGFGLPYAEAMSMGLPTIGTNYGGQLQFMNLHNSYLIDVIGERDPDQEFVIPNVKHLKKLMKYVYSNRNEAKLMGKRARQYIEQNLTHQVVNQILIKQLRRIEKKIQQANSQQQMSDNEKQAKSNKQLKIEKRSRLR
ncbi:hypothetical protein C9374_012757 [Naegleria lovaniensis]|uniref:Glycosyl transferase family 1 domain-containing protein n=1 Tax=Naegleria lovaniensis TaxID=51637 RepID=A0AA88G726_NAELO|nr:uncharacterized protein C9374_012757 [Naegleria lovaniensis]KAG2373155.1 hypothetical protein C9374_012757 [Naegleria lovaniensis]